MSHRNPLYSIADNFSMMVNFLIFEIYVIVLWVGHEHPNPFEIVTNGTKLLKDNAFTYC